MMERGEVAFPVVGDISKAHRRVKHCEEEHGFLGCQIDEASDDVYVNKVGTFVETEYSSYKLGLTHKPG